VNVVTHDTGKSHKRLGATELTLSSTVRSKQPQNNATDVRNACLMLLINIAETTGQPRNGYEFVSHL
jgi:hypothetical protein